METKQHQLLSLWSMDARHLVVPQSRISTSSLLVDSAEYEQPCHAIIHMEGLLRRVASLATGLLWQSAHGKSLIAAIIRQLSPCRIPHLAGLAARSLAHLAPCQRKFRLRD